MFHSPQPAGGERGACAGSTALSWGKTLLGAGEDTAAEQKAVQNAADVSPYNSTPKALRHRRAIYRETKV